MKHSVGKRLTAGVANTVFTVPQGYKAEVDMLFISNLDANNKTTTAYWQHAHNINHKIRIIDLYPMASHSFIQFSDGSIIMQQGDSFVIQPEAGATQDCIITFDLRKEIATFAFDGE